MTSLRRACLALILTFALSTPAFPQQTAFAPGDPVEVYKVTDWVEGRILRVDKDGILVIFPLADGTYDEHKSFTSYIPEKDIRRKGAAAPKPAGGKTPGAGAYAAGQEVMVYHLNEWAPGRVIRQDKDGILVMLPLADGTYDEHKSASSYFSPKDVKPAAAGVGNEAPKQDEPAAGGNDEPPANASAGKAPAPDPAAVDAGVVGVHLWTQVTPQTGTRIIRYLLRADGTFVKGRAFPGGENLDYAAAVQKFPSEAGTYKVEGAALTLTTQDGNVQNKELVPGPHGTRIKGWQRGIPFPEGHRLEASYDVKGGVAIAGATGDKSQVWTFHADGSCEVSEERAVSVPGAKASSEGLSWKGTYTLKHHTLSMSFAGGGQRDYTVFLSGEELSTAPKMLFVDMSVFKQRE